MKLERASVDPPAAHGGPRLSWAVMLGCWALFACGSDDSDAVSKPSREKPRRERTTSAAPEPEAAEGSQLPVLCARDRKDKVREVFCSENAPQISSLNELQRVLDLEPPVEQGSVDALLTNPTNLQYAQRVVVVLGHSTALSGHQVSALNPRILILGSSAIMAFQRGVQKVEVIAFSRGGAPALNFYLFRFEQACNHSEHGCSAGDLYTPRIENDWLKVELEDDDDLANTPSDCRQCHQRAVEQPRLLMRELNNPWTHFFEPLIEFENPSVEPGLQGTDLMQDYLKAKGDELYAGFDVRTIAPIAPFILESTVGPDQPVFFDAPGIEHERWPYDPTNGFPMAPSPSPTWERAYEAFKRGEQLALPYLELRVTDLDKQIEAADAYAKYRARELSADELPSLLDIFPDDPAVRARIGLQTEPGATPEETLIQACGTCHNDVLDQSLSRARFNINLWKLDKAEIRVAIERIQRKSSEPGVMPPPEARQLDPHARKRLLEYLEGDPLRGDASEMLVHAAEVGMTGGAKPRGSMRR